MPADTARKAAQSARKSTAKATRSAAGATGKAAQKARRSTKRAVGAARATRAAKGGMVEDARQVAAETGAQSAAAEAIAEAEAMHSQVEVNKRGLSVKALTKTLNDRWENGWRLAHIVEQRGNTVLVFEKRG